MDILNNFWNIIHSWILTNGLQLAFIIIGTIIVRYIVKFSLARIIRKIIPRESFRTESAEKKREDTLISISDGVFRFVIWTIAILMILSQFGVDIGPLLAAAGVVGLAVGFGGQYLIRDVFAGLFIILENQYRVGDVVSFEGTAGLVENVTIRTVTLRDLDGTVHHIPHGSVSFVSNLSKGYSRVNLNIGVSYSADIEHVISVVNKVGEDLANDPKWKEFILKTPTFLRIDNFADSAVEIKILGDTEPAKQWDVTGELRKRLKIAFDKEGIEIPFPQRVIHKS